MAKTTPIRQKRNQSEYAYEQLKEMILSGELPPGSRLVEGQLATRLKISRTPVREALRQLITEHFVSRDERGGLAVHLPTRREIDDIYLIREVLEGLAARLAARRVSQTEIARLEQTVEAIERGAVNKRIDEVVTANVAFHDLLHEATGNERLVKLGQELRNSIMLFSREAYTAVVNRAEITAREHAEILEALKDRDPDRAEKAAREHVRNARVATTEQDLFEEFRVPTLNSVQA